MRKLFLLSVVAGLFFAACGNHQDAPVADSTAVDSTTAVADTTAAADTTVK